MDLNCKNVFLLVMLIFSVFTSGCEMLTLRDWNDTRSLEEYGDKVALTMATLVTYIGSNMEKVKDDFGEPVEIKQRSGMIGAHYKTEKVHFDEIWIYVYMKGVPMINAESSRKIFYFDKGVVVSVDAN